MYKVICIALMVLVLGVTNSLAQVDGISVDYNNPKTYEIESVTITGVKYLQKEPIVRKTGLKIGGKITIPGDKISEVIDRLWKAGLFSDVKVSAKHVGGNKIAIIIYLQERPRMGKITFTGVKKNESTDLLDLIKFKRGTQITDNIFNKAENKLLQFYREKGYSDVKVAFNMKNDSLVLNHANITININKGEKFKIETISFEGNKDFPDEKLRRKLKETKQKTWYNIFKRSKYIKENFEEDKKMLSAFYKANGYRDAEITNDTVYVASEKLLKVEIDIAEGKQYFFRDVSWVGNTKYNSVFLSALLGIKKGEVYDEDKLSERIFGMEGISSLYLDDGYLFFNADPVEVAVDGDSIDVEVRVYEGRQLRIGNVIIKGNDKTHDHVIRREIRTKPGQLFSRADVIRTQRELAQLGYFNPETMQVNPIPNEADGTVDIEYILEEKSSDQIELSGGLSGSQFIGSIGLVLNNFSSSKFFRGKGFTPLPSGDGQRLNLKGSANLYYQSLMASFTEPWLGGRKPNSLSVAYSLSKYDYSGSIFRQSASVGFGRRLNWPDDYFTLYNELSYKKYITEDYQLEGFPDDDMISRSLTLANVMSRNSVDQPLYPQRGSDISLRTELALPVSLFDESALEEENLFKWLEYHKWVFKYNNYTSIVKKLVLATKTEFGFVGNYNKLKPTPFERFAVGGSMMQQMNYGTDFVSLRGYDESSLAKNGFIYNKYSLEVRYPLTLSNTATIYGLVFAEAGNAWYNFSDYDPFDVKRSAGFGIRMFMPMFGLLGFDLGYGFDSIEEGGAKSGFQPHFILGQSF